MGGHFDLDAKSQKIKELTKELNDENTWKDVSKSTAINSELVNLQKQISTYQNIVNELEDYSELINILGDEELKEIDVTKITDQINELEINTLFTGEYDDAPCFLEIHPGAGGTESCDWSSMLLRMYKMFCDKNGYTYEELDCQKGEEAGIKSATIKITGPFAYGYFKGEQGVHRLVRISPFDSNKRRHTSFASVNVTPEIKMTNEVNIKDEEIRVDVYRSSGKGGQGVNTTDSAVRITHLPTGIVVQCQNERSQFANKDTAMAMLKSKLIELKERAHKEKIEDLTGELKDMGWGSQIRSYVFHPYNMVKDHRTNEETSNLNAVMNGEIDQFIVSYLKEEAKK